MSSRPPTVLICDDAAFMRRMLADILITGGYSVAGEAANGAEAVEMYRTLHPRMVTMEAVMPGLGGIEALRQIIEDDLDARVLMCSSIGHQAVIDAAMEAGAREFVIKPFRPARLLEAAQRVLR